MTTVSIVFEPLKRFPRISIDGDHISPYSDLASCENKDLHVCGVRLFKLLDDEIGTEYRVEVTGIQFQIDLLDALAKQSEFCVSVEGKLTEEAFGLDETMNFAIGINEKYSLGVDPCTPIAVGGDLAETVNMQGVVTEGPAEVCIVSQITDTIEKGKTVLQISDHYDVKNIRGLNIVMIPGEQVNRFLEYYERYTKKIPFIDTVFSHSRYVSLNTQESTLLDAYVTQTPKYVFEVAKTALEAGEAVDYKFEVLPSSASSQYSLKVNNAETVQLDGSRIYAKKAGNVILGVFDRNGKMCESVTLIVSQHRYVNSINLVVSSASIEVGKKGQIDAYVMPEDAEDAHDLKWESSDPNIVHVASTGMFVALMPGIVTITVSSQTVTEQVSIMVLPTLERIAISEPSKAVQVGATECFTCKMFPPNAAHGEILWELSNDGLGTLEIRNQGRTCMFTAATSVMLKGSLTCRVKGTDKTDTCAIELIPEKKPTALMTITIIVTVIGLLFSFFIPLYWHLGDGLMGILGDICLPISIILCLIGKAATNNKQKIFGLLLILDLVFGGVMTFIAVTCCNPS